MSETETKTTEQKTDVLDTKHRVFNIMQYEQNPVTGKDLNFNEDVIRDALIVIKAKNVKWAYICHDKDTYTEEDVKRLKKKYKKDVAVGDIKPRHWHVVLQYPDQKTLKQIVTNFNVPKNQVDLPKGRNAFLNCVEYLTHSSAKEQAKGKHLYPDSEVKANFDWRNEIKQLELKRLRYGGRDDLSEVEEMEYDIRINGMSLRECMERNDLLYIKIERRLKQMRLDYLRSQQPPNTRINFYFDGVGGIGKTTASIALAKVLYASIIDPAADITKMNDDEIYFFVGAKGVTFEGYDGQPIIIWDDYRAIDLLTGLNGRENVFDIFDTHPKGKNKRQQIKFDSVNLPNKINIVNGIQPYIEFLNGLVGEYTDRNNEKHRAEDKSQSYRRFPFIIPIREEDFDILMNKGFMEGTREYEQYLEYKHIRGSMAKIAQACGSNNKLAYEIQSRALKPIADKTMEAFAVSDTPVADDETILEMFKDVGTPDEEAIIEDEVVEYANNFNAVWSEIAYILQNRKDFCEKDGEKRVLKHINDTSLMGRYTEELDKVYNTLQEYQSVLDEDHYNYMHDLICCLQAEQEEWKEIASEFEAAGENEESGEHKLEGEKVDQVSTSEPPIMSYDVP